MRRLFAHLLAIGVGMVLMVVGLGLCVSGGIVSFGTLVGLFGLVMYLYGLGAVNRDLAGSHTGIASRATSHLSSSQRGEGPGAALKGRRPAVYYAIAFAAARWIDVERPPGQALGRLFLRAGTTIRAQIKPYVVEGPEGPMEVADLFFEDGGAIRAMPYACFSFAE
jgi:hypothetical protein